MFLAFQLRDIITIPFGYLLEWLYNFTTNYGVALILFAIIVRLVLLPITAKSRKSMMKMSRMQPKMQEIQKKYENDQAKQQEAIRQLQKEEGVGMGCGGCLWSLIPMLLLIPLYQVIRQPLTYMLHESADAVKNIVDGAVAANPDAFTQKMEFYKELIAARQTGMLNFRFLGIDLGQMPAIPFTASWAWDWTHIGAFLIPILSAGSQVVSMLLSQRSNDSVITNEKGLQDKEAAKNSQQNQSGKMMMWMMPLISLWIGFTVPAALSLYWFIGGVIAMVENEVLTRHYRKVYDAEDAARLQKALEAEALEAEKERLRAQKRAANPDGITENTSKKKLQQAKKQEQEAAKRDAAKEYAAKKGIQIEEEEKLQALSGDPSRPYAKGRAYDPNRYSGNSEE